jgi:hypothetical protein
MARLILLLVLVAGCDEETTAFALDQSVVLDLSISACNAGTGAVCSASPLDWCQPTPSSQDICVCTSPAQTWFCCSVDNFQCPSAPRTGDFCCPQPSGFRRCGACDCVSGQFVCGDIDLGPRD